MSNQYFEKGGVKDLVAEIYEICGEIETTRAADAIKDIGFEYATRSGYTLAVSDITVPPEKEEIVNNALDEVEIVQRNFRRGLLTEQEQNEHIIDIWQKTTTDVGDAVRRPHGPGRQPGHHGQFRRNKGGFQPSPSWLVCVV